MLDSLHRCKRKCIEDIELSYRLVCKRFFLSRLILIRNLTAVIAVSAVIISHGKKGHSADRLIFVSILILFFTVKRIICICCLISKYLSRRSFNILSLIITIRLFFCTVAEHIAVCSVYRNRCKAYTVSGNTVSFAILYCNDLIACKAYRIITMNVPDKSCNSCFSFHHL